MRHGWDGAEQWPWAYRSTSNRRKPRDSDRDVPSFVVTYPCPAKNISNLVPCGPSARTKEKYGGISRFALSTQTAQSLKSAARGARQQKTQPERNERVLCHVTRALLCLQARAVRQRGVLPFFKRSAHTRAHARAHAELTHELTQSSRTSSRRAHAELTQSSRRAHAELHAGFSLPTSGQRKIYTSTSTRQHGQFPPRSGSAGARREARAWSAVVPPSVRSNNRRQQTADRRRRQRAPASDARGRSLEFRNSTNERDSLFRVD